MFRCMILLDEVVYLCVGTRSIMNLKAAVIYVLDSFVNEI
jgi:hypothetical protein